MKIRTADWKVEKHVPAIDVRREGDWIVARVSVGKEIPHPNTPEHHIAWIELYLVRGDVPVLVGRAEFSAHGEAGVASEPVAEFRFRADQPGRLVALAYCNIHGLWEGEASLEV